MNPISSIFARCSSHHLQVFLACGEETEPSLDEAFCDGIEAVLIAHLPTCDVGAQQRVLQYFLNKLVDACRIPALHEELQVEALLGVLADTGLDGAVGDFQVFDEPFAAHFHRMLNRGAQVGVDQRAEPPFSPYSMSVNSLVHLRL